MVVFNIIHVFINLLGGLLIKKNMIVNVNTLHLCTVYENKHCQKCLVTPFVPRSQSYGLHYLCILNIWNFKSNSILPMISYRAMHWNSWCIWFSVLVLNKFTKVQLVMYLTYLSVFVLSFIKFYCKNVYKLLFLCQLLLFLLKNKQGATFNHWLNDLTHLCRLVNFSQYLTSG